MGRKPDFLVTDHAGFSSGIRRDTLNQDKVGKEIAELIIPALGLSIASSNDEGEARQIQEALGAVLGAIAEASDERPLLGLRS